MGNHSVCMMLRRYWGWFAVDWREGGQSSWHYQCRAICSVDVWKKRSNKFISQSISQFYSWITPVFFPWLFLSFCSVRWDKNLGKYSLFVYVFQNRKGWLDWVRVICVTHTNFIHSDQFTFSIVVYQSEQYLHCRLGRYYSRRDPLQVQGEAAAKLAEDLKIIVCNVKEGKMNPGSMYIMPHFNHTDSKKKIHSSIWQPFCILIMPHINISTKQQVNPCFMSIIPCFKATI